MKRRILTYMMIAALSASLIAGCGSGAETAATTAAQTAMEATTISAAEVTTEATTEVVTEALEETTTEDEVLETEQELSEYYVNFNVHTTGGVKITSDDGEGGKLVDETMGYGFSSFTGKTIKESMKEFGILDIEIVEEDDTFEGWMEYRDVMTMDPDGFEYCSSYEKVSDNLYTTEDVLSMVLDAHTTFVAKWESISDEEYYLNYEHIDDGLDLSVTIYGNGGHMNYESSYSYESDLSVATIESGLSLEAFLGDPAKLKSVEREGYMFNGWCVYASDDLTYVNTLDEALNAGSFCVSLEQYGYAAMDEWVVVNEFATTEELYDIVCDGKSYLVLANWVEGEKEILTCSGCEIEKVCGKYEVNGQTYIVCDSCYNEFATGMGLKND